MSSKRKQKRTRQDPTTRGQEVVAPPELIGLWNLCAERSREADWLRLVRRLDGIIRLYLRECLGDSSDQSTERIDDLVQELYCRLLDRDRLILRSCRASQDGQVLAYLRTICRSVVVDDHRFRSAAKRLPVHGVDQDSELQLALDRVPARDPSPEQRLVARELRRGLRQAMEKIYRQHVRRNGWIFERAVFEGWTSREIARCVDLRPSSIDTVVHRTKRRLGLLGLAIPARG